MHRVLAASRLDEVADLITRTHREQHNGWVVAAVCAPGAVGEDGGGGDVRGVPVVGDLESVAALAWEGGYRVVAIAPDWTRRRLRELGPGS